MLVLFMLVMFGTWVYLAFSSESRLQRLLALVVAAGFLTAAFSLGSEARAEERRPLHRHHVIVRDSGILTEDDAASLTLVEFDRDAGRFVYRTAGSHGDVTRYDAVVGDRGRFTEDDAARVRLVRFERDGDAVRLVYRTV